MARPARSRGPFRDPRLVERQGDVLGPSSLLLVVLMVCAVVAMGALVVGLGRLVPTPAPAPIATAAPSTLTFVTPDPTQAGPSSSPSPSPRPLAVSPDALRVAFGDPAPVVERGVQVGTVTVTSIAYRSVIRGVEASSGRRWFRVSLTFQATAALPYDGNRWSVLDANDKRYRWARARASRPAARGRHARSGSRTDWLPRLLRPVQGLDQVTRAPGCRRQGHRGAGYPIGAAAPAAEACPRPMLRA